MLALQAPQAACLGNRLLVIIAVIVNIIIIRGIVIVIAIEQLMVIVIVILIVIVIVIVIVRVIVIEIVPRPTISSNRMIHTLRSIITLAMSAIVAIIAPDPLRGCSN